MNRYTIFLLSIAESRHHDVNVMSVVNAAVVGTSEDGSKLDVKIASNITIRDLLAKTSKLNGEVRIGNFYISSKTNEVEGTGTISIKELIRGGANKAVVVGEIKRLGSSETVGYIMCDREGKAGQLTKEKAVQYMIKNGHDSVQNLMLCRPGYGKKDYVSLKDSRNLPVYIIGAVKREAKQVHVPVEQERDKGNTERKEAVLKKLAGKQVGRYLDSRYDLEAIMFIMYLAKKHRKYTYLLNPKYTADQMRVIHSGYREGYDISKFNDPTLSSTEMLDRLNLMRLGVWVDVQTSKM